MDLFQSPSFEGVIWGIGCRRARGEEVDSDLGPGISYFWWGDVVLEEIIEGLGSVVKLGLCLRSHNSDAGSDVQNKLCSKNWKQGLNFLFLYFFGKSKASRFEQQEQDKSWSTFRCLHN